MSAESIVWFRDHFTRLRWLFAALLLLMVAGVFVLVYQTGGIKFVYSHSMYVPVLLAGFAFGIKGGVLIGILGGITLGPFMPIDVATGEAQQTGNWLYRTGFFTLAGLLSGAASDGARSYVEHLNWSARHDEATRLPNRLALVEALKGDHRTRGSRGALVMLHLENSNELASAFGFVVVDDVIRQISIRLAKNIPAGQSAYRLDSDKLAVLLDDGVGNDPQSVISNFSAHFREPFSAGDIRLHGDVRMGCVYFIRGEEDPRTVIRDAQAALTVASLRAQDSTVFGAHMHTDARENLQHLGELQSALDKGLLSLHYQPKVGLACGRVHGVEALMRWHHPVRGNIPPSKFIPRAELSTLIDPLTDFAIDEALRQLREWNDQGMNLTVAVNISARNLLQPRFADRIRESLARHGLRAEQLELEVTENALMVDIEAAMTELSRLSDMNIVLSIDDFGTGYSSLQYLNELPVSVIKVDQSFVRKLPSDTGAAHIVKAAIGLAHNIDLRVVAEGVENRETLDFLRDIGCDLAQGFHICRPSSAANFSNWYVRGNGHYH